MNYLIIVDYGDSVETYPINTKRSADIFADAMRSVHPFATVIVQENNNG